MLRSREQEEREAERADELAEQSHANELRKLNLQIESFQRELENEDKQLEASLQTACDRIASDALYTLVSNDGIAFLEAVRSGVFSQNLPVINLEGRCNIGDGYWPYTTICDVYFSVQPSVSAFNPPISSIYALPIMASNSETH